jgi:WD40 repeat protein
MNKIILTGFILLCFTEFISGKVPLRYIGPETKVRDFCISNDGLQVYAAFGNTIGIYDIETGNHVRSLGSSHGDKIISVGLASDNSILVYGTDEGRVEAHDLVSGGIFQADYSNNIITSIDIHSGENLIVAGTFDGEIIVIDIEGNILWRQYLHDDAVSKVLISTDGRFIVSSGLDGKALVTLLREGRKTEILMEGKIHADILRSVMKVQI